MDTVNLRKRSGEVIGKNEVMDVNGSRRLAGIHAPRLLVEFGPWQGMVGGAQAMSSSLT